MRIDPRIPGAFGEYINSETETGKKKKKRLYVEKDPVTGIPVPRVPELDDERDIIWLGNPYMSEQGSAMTRMSGYGSSNMSSMLYQPMMSGKGQNPSQQMMQGRQGLAHGKFMQNTYGAGGLHQTPISYTAADGTMYSIGVTTAQKNRGDALYGMLTGLYGIMMSEGQSGNYSQSSDGYAPRGYAGGKSGEGGKSSYAGSKG